MRILKWVAIAGLALAVLLGVGIAILLNVDVNRFKPEIIAAVEQATGRKLTIAGDIKLAVWPSIAASVKGVALSNAEGGSQPVMVRVGEFVADLDLFALLGQKVKVDRLILADVDLVLEKDRRGRGNWEFGAPAAASAPAVPQASGGKPAAGAGGPMALPAISNVLLRNVKIGYRDAAAGSRYDAAVAELSLKAGKGDILQMRLRANLDGNDILADGTFGGVDDMLAGSKPWPVKLALSIPGADMKATVEGAVAKPMEGRGYGLKITADASDLAKLGALAKQTIPSIGPLSLVADLKDEGGEPSIPALRLTLGTESAGRIQVNGAIRQPLAQKGVNLAIDFATPSAKQFAAQFGVAIAQALPVKLRADVKDAGTLRYALAGIAADIGGSDIGGSGEISLAGTRPAVKFDLASKSLDLVSLLGDKPGEAAKAPAKPSDATAKTKDGGASAKVFSSDPLPLDSLKAVDADLRFRADRLKAPKLQAQAVNVALALKDGVLAVRPFGLGLSGGTLGGDLQLNGQTGALTVKLDGRNIGLADYLKSENLTDVLHRDARTDLQVELVGQGKSVAALMAGLNGKAILKIGEGELRDQYLDFLGGDILGMLGKLGQASAKTKLECVVAGFDVKSGIATPRAILVETGRITIAGEGKVDLAQEQLGLKLTPNSRDAALASAAIPVNVTGSFASPSIAPEAGAVVKGVVGAVAGAALLGPAAILSPLVSSGAAGERGQAACQRAVALAEGRTPPPAATGAQKSGASPAPTAPQPQTTSPPNPLKGLGNLLKR